MKLTTIRESWPIAGAFTISRGSKTAADVVVVTLERDGVIGRGECVPYRRYEETVEGVIAELESKRSAIESGMIDRSDVPRLCTLRAAQNALDCALWDLEAKQNGKRIWDLLGLHEPKPLVTAYTLSLGSIESMSEAAERAAERELLKVKLGGAEDAACLEAVRRAAPKSRLIVDANEGWKPADLPRLLDACARAGVELVEQPLPAGDDEALRDVTHAVPICADESAHDARGLEGLRGKYDAINIKLDKTGGLTAALEMKRAAEAIGFDIMVGCMVATSLSMAPANVLAQGASVVDLDGPLLLAKDRPDGILYEGNRMFPAASALWG